MADVVVKRKRTPFPSSSRDVCSNNTLGSCHLSLNEKSDTNLAHSKCEALSLPSEFTSSVNFELYSGINLDPGHHVLSLELASQVENFSQSCQDKFPHTQVVIAIFSPGVVEVGITISDGPYSCRDWNVRIGGIGSSIDTFQFFNSNDTTESSSCFMSAPVSVRFSSVPFSHCHTDDSGFVDFAFWEPLLGLNPISLEDIITRIIETLLGPFINSSTSNKSSWQEGANHMTNKINVIKSYELIARHSDLISHKGRSVTHTFKSNWFHPNFYNADEQITTNNSTNNSFEIWRNKYCDEISPGIFSFDFFQSRFLRDVN